MPGWMPDCPNKPAISEPAFNAQTVRRKGKSLTSAAYLPAEKDALRIAKEKDMNDHDIQTIIDAFRNGATTVAELTAATGFSRIRTALITAKLIKDGFVVTAS